MKPAVLWNPVPFPRVHVAGPFWEPRLQVNREQTIPVEYAQCKETGRIDALRLDWRPGKSPKPHIFWDSDIAKWIEAASYSLATHPDAHLDALLDEVIGMVARAQQPDGYLNIYFTAVEPGQRWTDLRDAHELYCAGHLMEAAVAHFQATGKRSLLDVICRYADHIAAVFGPEPEQKRGYCGHPEVELALVKLYRATGEARYLKLSQFFVDERGRQPVYFEQERKARGGTPSFFERHFGESGRPYNYEYNQSHKPVREQESVVGHAVRAMYLYSAMADLAGEVGDPTLLQACERLWAHLTGQLMYVTGGIGSTARNEGFTFEYDLPNESAYCETCASIGLVFWAHRLLQLDCDARYADTLERALYNGVAGGVSQDGRKFFYDNPLASMGRHHRREWFDCACCPPNLARLFASLGGYIYAERPDEAVVHLYAESEGELRVAGRRLILRQETRYPWDGQVAIHVEPESPASFAIRLRIPGWCRQAAIQVNGEAVPFIPEKGYARIERRWEPGDLILLDLAMPVERVYTSPRVRMNCGRVALQRGPVIFCLEGADNGADLNALALPRYARLEAVWEAGLLGGVMTIQGHALKALPTHWNGPLYLTEPGRVEPVAIKAVPYCTWDNREAGEMLVWLREC